MGVFLLLTPEIKRMYRLFVLLFSSLLTLAAAARPRLARRINIRRNPDLERGLTHSLVSRISILASDFRLLSYLCATRFHPFALILEICIDNLASARAAAAGGADRLELTSALEAGGLTPGPGLLAAVQESVDLPIMMMVRPRSGDFCYDADEIRMMEREIRWARDQGVAGVVFGALKPDGTIDEAATRHLIEVARPLQVTFHRAFDVCRNPRKSLDVLMALGVERVLTSGQSVSAGQGIPMLRDLVKQAGDALIILAGSGVNTRNIHHIVRETGVRECHGSASELVPSPMRFQRPGVSMGAVDGGGKFRRQTDPEVVRALKQAMLEAGAGDPIH